MLVLKRSASTLLAILAALLALAAISCSGESPTSVNPVADAGSDSEANLATHANAGHIVNGKGTVWLGDPRNQWLNISFHARSRPDGTVHGSWHHQFRTREPGGRIVVQVTCLSVVGNQAWMGGYSTQAGNPDNVGKWFGLHVIDNGEGHGAADEMSRTLWFGPDEQRAIDLCEQMTADHAITPIVAGNVQVR